MSFHSLGVRLFVKKKKKIKSAAGIAVGDIVTLGRYPQDKSGEPAPIEWQVLDIDEEGYLLLSLRCLEARSFYELNPNGLREIPWEKRFWENCDLRAWLNGDFFKTAFADGERDKLLLTTIKGAGPNDTKDTVFLLSEKQAAKYLPSPELRIALPTECARASGAVGADGTPCKAGEPCLWWLLPKTAAENSPADDPHARLLEAVTCKGTFFAHSHTGYRPGFCVRPAMRLKLPEGEK